MNWFKRFWNWVRPKKHYKYVLKTDKIINHERLRGVNFENEWCKISNGVMIVRSGYAWDGCSPKYIFVGLVLGTPDGKNDECKWASMVHDVLCQFRDEILISKQSTLEIFRDMLDDADWAFTDEYVWAVDKHGPQNWLLK